MATDNSLPPNDGADKARKRKRSKTPTLIAQFSHRKPVWAYLRLRRMHKTSSAVADEVTISLLLNSALQQFLGLHGAAIQRDFLKVEGDDFWIRIANQDLQAVVAALSSWSRNGEMIRVVGTSSWDASALGQDAGQDLFTD